HLQCVLTLYFATVRFPLLFLLQSRPTQESTLFPYTTLFRSPMLCVTIFVILVVWFLLPRVARLMIHTPTAISIFVCIISLATLGSKNHRSEERFSRNAETDLVCRLLLERKKGKDRPISVRALICN